MKCVKCVMLRIEGVFFFHLERDEDDDDDDDDDDDSLTDEEYHRIVGMFIAENPGLNREDLDIVEVEVCDADEA